MGLFLMAEQLFDKGKIKKRGMTLVELIVSMSIMGIILTPLASIFYFGYNNYFAEHDTMTAQQCAKEVLNSIIDDLRSYENQSTRIDILTNSLIVRDSVDFPGNDIVYVYDEEQKTVLRNGNSLISDSETQVTNFSMKQVKPDDYDSSVIKIVITVCKGKGEEMTLEGNFRRKY